MYNAGKNGPCRNCEERYPACWGTCEKYAAMLEDREKSRKKSNASRVTNEYSYDALTKTKKRIGKK